MATGSDQGLAVELQPLFQKLKPGPGLPAEQVFADQRRRLHGATIALVDRDGPEGLRVRSVARAAGVSTSTFYKHFANADDCLTSTYQNVMARVVGSASAVQRRQAKWRDSLLAVVAKLMEDLANEPRAAHLVLVDIFAAGPNVRRCIAKSTSELEALVASSFASAPRTVTPPRHLIAGMTAGMLRVARNTTLTGRAAELPAFAEEVGGWMMTLPNPEVLSLLAALSPSADESRRERNPFPSVEDKSSRGGNFTEYDRLIRAVLKLAEQDGFTKLTVSRVRVEAGASRKAFNAHFANLEDCFLAAVELITTNAAAAAHSWSANTDDWKRRTGRFLLALCAQAARERPQTQLAFLGTFATGHSGLLQRERWIGRLTAALRDTIPTSQKGSVLAIEASVAAAWYVVQSDILAGRVRRLPMLASLLTYVILAPVVGAERAAVVARSETLRPTTGPCTSCI